MMLVLFDTEPRADIDTAEYERAGERRRRSSQMPGFVSAKRYSASDGESFTMVKFESEEALEAWRQHPEHVAVQRRGREYEWRRGG